MNSKEALKSLCNQCETLKSKNVFIGCPFRNISNDYCEEFETIEKDLEGLEILKRNIYVADNTIYATPNELEKDDYKKIKEWYENGI